MFRPVPIERRTAPLQVERGVSSALALAGAISFSFLLSNIGNLVSKGNAVEVRASAAATAKRPESRG